MSAANRDRPSTQKGLRTVYRAVQVLYLIGNEGAQSVRSVAGKTRLSRSVAHRILLSLENCGAVVRTARGYALGAGFLDFDNKIDLEELLTIKASPILKDLSSEFFQNTNLHVRDGPYAKCLVYLASSRSPTGHRRQGMSEFMHLGSPGKILLAALSEEDLDAYLKANVTNRRTNKSITDPKEIRRQIALVKLNRYAMSREEYQIGMGSLAVPLLDRRERWIGSVGLSFDLHLLRADYVEQVVEELRTASRRITDALFPAMPLGRCTGEMISEASERQSL